MVPRNFKETAEAKLGQKVTQTVITIPTHFNDAQLQATKNTGTSASLTTLHIVNEPTITIIAYGLNMKKNSHGADEPHITVYNLGEGTFDVSLFSVNDSVFDVGTRVFRGSRLHAAGSLLEYRRGGGIDSMRTEELR